MVRQWRCMVFGRCINLERTGLTGIEQPQVNGKGSSSRLTPHGFGLRLVDIRAIGGDMAARGDRRRRGRRRGGGAYVRKDGFYRRAKEEGYRSRAAYKLLEADEKYRLIPRRGRVLDLGCWPGGWLQVAVALAGEGGCIVGVDLRETEEVPGAVALCGDVEDSGFRATLAEHTRGGKFDVILADLAPSLSGVRARDEAQAAALNETTLSVADSLLAPRGCLFMKTFMNSETEGILRLARGLFASVRLTSLDASRKGSSEHYLIGRERRSPTESAD